MAKVGVIRRFDDLGRICIPREIRMMVFGKSDAENEPVEIFVDGGNIVLQRYIEAESEVGKELRAKAIDEFYDKALNFEDYIEPLGVTDIEEDSTTLLYSGKDITNMIVKIAKELKGETV